MRRRTRRPAVLHLRKLKAGPGTNVPSLSRAGLMQLIEEAVLDAYTEEEQAVGFLTMIEEHLALPFSVKILGVDADVEKVDMTLDGQNCCHLPPRQNAAENPNPRLGLTGADSGRCRMDCRLSLLMRRFSVSEYQYFDFRALDRPVTRNEMATLRSISTRAAITATSFTNHYEWCDLKANPSKLLETYFDVYVYVANWGTREFHIRLPQESIDYRLLKAIVLGESLRVRKTGTFVIVEFRFESEWDGEDDGTRWMASLMPLRSDFACRRLPSRLASLCTGWRT
jgi:hypothetical protein